MLNIEKPRLALLSDSSSIVQIVLFYLESHYDTRVFQYNSSSDFLKNYQNNFDLIVTSPKNLKNLSKIDSKLIFELETPFQYNSLQAGVSKKLKARTLPSYVPVRIEYLLQIQTVHVPLFLKINENKYVKLEHSGSIFTQEKYLEQKQKGLTSLYILNSDVDELIQSHIQTVLSDMAWDEAENYYDQIVVNMEAMKTFSEKVGWGPQVLELAQHNTRKALALAKKTKNLESAFRQFQKIEKFGFADRCLLMTLVATKLAEKFLSDQPEVFRKLTFACLFHDITLDESMLQNQDKLDQQMRENKNPSSKLLQDFSLHPIRAAAICRSWNLCPPGADRIILNHHEEPDGDGFPYGKFDLEMELDSVVFKITLDFVNHYIAKFGELTPAQYFQKKANYLSSDSFRSVLEGFAQLK